MVPAGDPTESMVNKLAALFEPGDILIDGGNSYYKDDVRRADALREKGIQYVDAGTSGGVWGIERGYCLMVGAEPATFKHLEPIFKTLAPGTGNVPPTAGRATEGRTAHLGYLHCGPNGAGHFVKMVHNGIEYGLMQAYGEGFDIMKNATSKELPEGHRYDLDLGEIAELWRRGSVVSSWLLDLSAIALTEDPALEQLHRLRAGFGRRPLDHPGRARRSGSGGRADRGALRPLPFAPGSHLHRENALGHAPTIRRPHGTASAAKIA